MKNATDTINAAARSVSRSDYEDDGMFLDAVHEVVAEAAKAAGVTGTFDDESLTWTSDDACQTLREAQVSFAAFCKLLGLTAHNEEEAVLNAGREFLPPCAIKVLDGGEPTLEYYEFLTHQVRASREGQR